jgi:3-oxoacyl-[acyl-carrier protein] reductase
MPYPSRGSEGTCGLTDESVTLVTGAAGLIGSAVLAKLQAQGRRAPGVDLSPKPQQSDVERADLTNVHRLHMIARDAGVKAIVHCGAVSLGPVDILVNCAGIGDGVPFEEISMAAFDRMIGVHLRGTFMVTQRFYCGMAMRG